MYNINYKIKRMGINLNNRDIYIVFSRTGTMFSNVIALFTQKEYSHVSLSLDASFNQMFSFGRKIPSRVLPAGLVKENLYDGVFAMYPKSRCLVYKINISDEQFLFLQNEIDNFFRRKHFCRRLQSLCIFLGQIHHHACIGDSRCQ